MLIAFEKERVVSLEGPEIPEFEEKLKKTKERFYQSLPLQILKEVEAPKRMQELDGSYSLCMFLENQSQTQTGRLRQAPRCLVIWIAHLIWTVAGVSSPPRIDPKLRIVRWHLV